MSDSLEPMDCSLPGSFVHGIVQAKILEWVAMPSSRVCIYMYIEELQIYLKQIKIHGLLVHTHMCVCVYAHIYMGLPWWLRW